MSSEEKAGMSEVKRKQWHLGWFPQEARLATLLAAVYLVVSVSFFVLHEPVSGVIFAVLVAMFIGTAVWQTRRRS